VDIGHLHDDEFPHIPGNLGASDHDPVGADVPRLEIAVERCRHPPDEGEIECCLMGKGQPSRLEVPNLRSQEENKTIAVDSHGGGEEEKKKSHPAVADIGYEAGCRFMPLPLDGTDQERGYHHRSEKEGEQGTC